jgi:hypothetical protein
VARFTGLAGELPVRVTGHDEDGLLKLTAASGAAGADGTRLPGLGRLTGVFARHRAERGDSVGMRLDPEGCHLFPAATATVPSVTAGVRGQSPYIGVQ